MRTPLVLLNARLLDPATGGFLPDTALAASGGRITALGDDRHVRALADASTTVIDLKGAVVTPGLVDGHIHPVSGAELTHGLDLSGCTDLEQVRTALAAGVRGLAPGAWLSGWGLDPNAFGDRPVETAPFDSVLDGLPATLLLFDAHSMLASRRALELAGVDGPRTFDQASAEVVCDAAGRPTGLLLEDAACELVERVAPQPTREERASRAWRCRDLWDSGATVVLGSDWPIAPYPPLGVMGGARHRRPSRDLTQAPHGPEQALTALQALQGMTVNAARAAGEEHLAGRIALGHRADLTVLADDPLTVAATELPDLPVLLTVVDGGVTHRAASL
ncbi:MULTISPECIES: amidohydrolase family protein [unclassified Streptomyces]|uniref:amidohydrolase family protein n=1 Tax=unclassified Streptomyces TaxID=2593676 RepID=UPI002E1363B5|nr:amidohydrolase family protein [Streptomyces sp. NBC_01207]WTA17471.1 amidohydrolase family protein [Streptomyces sp. NBC_00853]